MINTKKFYKKVIVSSILALSINLLSSSAILSKTNKSYIYNIPSISISKQLTKEKNNTRKEEEIKSLTVYEQQANTLFEKLYQKNSYLAEELGKIPEFLDGINENEVKALEEIVKLYIPNQDLKVEDAFNQILDEGNLKERKYCTPLRLLFWVAKEKNIDYILKDYSLKKIYEINNTEVSALNNFKEVTDMLNSPNLIDIYERSNFSYEDYARSLKSDEEVFKSKKANCKDTSEFTVYCLQKAGYNAGMIWVESRRQEGHIITYFKDKGKIFIMDNGRVNPTGILGPYDSFSKIPYSIRQFMI